MSGNVQQRWRRAALPPTLALACLLAAALPATAAPADELVSLINAYRAAPGSCEGRDAGRAPALTRSAALARVQVLPGTFLEHAIERAGYGAEHAEAIELSGYPDAPAAMAAVRGRYCRALLDARFQDIGVAHSGSEWRIVLATPAPPPMSVRYPDWREAGKAVLEAVNAARATARDCGERAFPAAPPLAWNAQLAEAALAHSRDMAQHRFFRHRGRDGSEVGQRATRAGYAWRTVGENIASGIDSPEETVQGWLESPGHCANIMNQAFTEMGAAYAVSPTSARQVSYWTQVLGRPR